MSDNSRKPPPGTEIILPTCPVCDDGITPLSTDGDSWWCEDCHCTWSFNGAFSGSYSGAPPGSRGWPIQATAAGDL